MEKELDALGGALESPARPFVAVLGGAKVADKLAVVENLLPKVDALLIGGGMAYTFLKAKGYEVGNSLLDNEKIADCRALIDDAARRGQRLELPSDVVVTTELKEGAPHKTVAADGIPADQMGADIGPETRTAFAEAIKGARTVFWNGPVGVFEIDALAEGTRAVARAVAESGANSIIGGGESVAAVEQMGFADKISHISTGGGASLEFMEGKTLPGVAALQDK
jgi:phosphoglycerate kinase